jgi:hypothetical protein
MVDQSSFKRQISALTIDEVLDHDWGRGYTEAKGEKSKKVLNLIIICDM